MQATFWEPRSELKHVLGCQKLLEGSDHLYGLLWRRACLQGLLCMGDLLEDFEAVQLQQDEHRAPVHLGWGCEKAKTLETA